MKGQRWIVDILTFFLLGLIFLEIIGLAVLMPQIIEDLNLSLIDVGLLLGIFSAGPGIFMGIISGIATDKLGPKMAGIFPLVGLIVVSIGVGISRTYTDIAVIFIMFGILQSFSNPVIYKLVGLWFNIKERGLGSAITNSAQQFFTFFSPFVFVGLFIFFDYNFRKVFLFSSIFTIPLIVSWFIFVYDRPESSPWIEVNELEKIYNERIADGRISKSNLKTLTTNRDRFKRLVREPPEEKRFSNIFVLKSLIRDKASLSLVLVSGTMGSVWLSYALILPTYLSSFMNYSEQQIGLVTSVIYLGGFVASILSGLIMLKANKKSVMLVSSSLTLVGTVSLSLFSQSTSIIVLVFFVSFGFFFTTMYYPALYSITEGHFGKSMLGRVLGVQFTLISIAATFSPYVMTYLATVLNWSFSFVFSTIMALMTIVLTTIVPKQVGKSGVTKFQ